jgi:hypothetical protein
MELRGRRWFYRIVRTRPPAFRDFLSPAATGRPAPGEPHIDRLWTAVSLWTSAEAARSRARRYPWLGRFIAVLEIDEWPGVRVEKTLGRGHVSAWADADALLGLVVDTIEVEE